MTGNCEICGKWRELDPHEVFSGPNRQKSKKYGLVMHVCRWCHTQSPTCVQYCRETNLFYKQKYQRIFEETHTREQFMQEFGKNYLDD